VVASVVDARNAGAVLAIAATALALIVLADSGFVCVFACFDDFRAAAVIQSM
jgi:hypothetical protein